MMNKSGPLVTKRKLNFEYGNEGHMLYIDAKLLWEEAKAKQAHT